MNNIQLCESLVREIYDEYDASHDFQHIERVRKNAKLIMESEAPVNRDIIEIAILLHDVSDPKYSGNEGKKKEKNILKQLQLAYDDHNWIEDIIQSVSFSGGHSKEATTLESQIVRDADRLDAIGAIGIARTFAYGGAKGRKLYNWNETARFNMTENEYRNVKTASVTHFYEKLLLLQDLMITKTAKRMAKQRHEFMLTFLEQLKLETSEEE